MFEKNLYETLARNLPGFGIFLYDASFQCVGGIGDDFLGIFGLIDKDILSRDLVSIPFLSEIDNLSHILRRGLEGEVIDCETEAEGHTVAVRISPVKGSSHGLIMCNDVSDMANVRKTLQSLSLTDELTGVYNRRGFNLLANQKIKKLDKAGALVFFVDLNDLKIINDTVGHDSGDEALVSAAKILSDTFRDSEDIVARYGGDEFIVFVSSVFPESATLFKIRIQEAVSEFNSHKHKFRLSMSVGHSYFDPSTPRDLESLIGSADKLMYAEKSFRRSHGSGSIQAVKITK